MVRQGHRAFGRTEASAGGLVRGEIALAGADVQARRFTFTSTLRQRPSAAGLVER